MMDKKKARLRRARRARAKMRELGANRLCVHRTPRVSGFKTGDGRFDYLHRLEQFAVEGK